jgi:hypothetical protein
VDSCISHENESEWAAQTGNVMSENAKVARHIFLFKSNGPIPDLN